MRLKGSKNSVPREIRDEYRRSAAQAMMACNGHWTEAARMLRKRYPGVKLPQARQYLKRRAWLSVLRCGDVRDAPRSGRPKMVSPRDAEMAAKAFTESEGLSGSRVQYENYTEVIVHQMLIKQTRV